MSSWSVRSITAARAQTGKAAARSSTPANTSNRSPSRVSPAQDNRFLQLYYCLQCPEEQGLEPVVLPLCTAIMSSSVNPRGTAYTDRRNGTACAKPRLPSSRATARERPSSSGDIEPDDSASNAPQRPNPSYRANGYSRNTTERQTSRVQSQLTTRESLHVRTKSPVKKYAVNGDDVDTRRPRSEEYGRLSSPVPATIPIPQTEKTNLRK